MPFFSPRNRILHCISHKSIPFFSEKSERVQLTEPNRQTGKMMATQNFFNWDRPEEKQNENEEKLHTLFRDALEKPLEIHPEIGLFYGFLFLNALSRFEHQKKFSNQIIQLFEKINSLADRYPLDNVRILAWSIQEEFSDMLTDRQKLRMALILDEPIEVGLGSKKEITIDENYFT